jgi:hypothetical protein
VFVQGQISEFFFYFSRKFFIDDKIPSETSQAFLEIKKKENKIGYKYRLILNKNQK